MELVFNKLNIRPTKKENQEKYDFPVLTVYAKPTTANSGYKFNLNKAALTELGSPEFISSVFVMKNDDDEVIKLTKPLLVKVSSDTQGNFKVFANGNFFSTVFYKLISEFYELSETEDYEFKLEKATIDGNEDLTVVAITNLIKDELPDELESISEEDLTENDDRVLSERYTPEIG